MNDPTTAPADHTAVVVGDTIEYDRYTNGTLERRTAVVTALWSDRFGATATDTGAFVFVPHGRFVRIVNDTTRPIEVGDSVITPAGNVGRLAIIDTDGQAMVEYDNPTGISRGWVPLSALRPANAPIRPVVLHDRAEAPMPFGGMTLRGTVVDITHPTAILDLDNGGRVSVMVDDLRPVEQVYLAGGDLAIDADAHEVTGGATAADVQIVTADGRTHRVITTTSINAKSSPNHIGGPNRAVYFAATGDGITMCVVHVDTETTHPVMFDFAAAADLHRALGELLHNPANVCTADRA